MVINSQAIKQQIAPDVGLFEILFFGIQWNGYMDVFRKENIRTTAIRNVDELQSF